MKIDRNIIETINSNFDNINKKIKFLDAQISQLTQTMNIMATKLKLVNDKCESLKESDIFKMFKDIPDDDIVMSPLIIAIEFEIFFRKLISNDPPILNSEIANILYEKYGKQSLMYLNILKGASEFVDIQNKNKIENIIKSIRFIIAKKSYKNKKNTKNPKNEKYEKSKNQVRSLFDIVKNI